MRLVYAPVNGGLEPTRNYIPTELFETSFGVMTLKDYLRMSAIIDRAKELAEEKNGEKKNGEE